MKYFIFRRRKPKTLPRHSCTVTDMRICERRSPPSNLAAFCHP